MKLSAELIAVIKANDVSKLKLTPKESLIRHDNLGNNVLHLAIQYGSMEAFEYLLTLDGIDKNQLNNRESTPLMTAFDLPNDNNRLYAVKLIESDCEFSTCLPDGDSALYWAAYRGWPEVVEVLIKKGVYIDVLNTDLEQTPLHVAAIWGHTDVIWMLLYYGADPNVTSLNEWTLFDFIYADEALLDQFSDFDKHFNMMRFVEALEKGNESFIKLMNITSAINYTYSDLESFSFKFFGLDSELFKIFAQKFGQTVEAIFWFYSSYYEGFNSEHIITSMPQKLCENLLILLDSDVISSIVYELNKIRILFHDDFDTSQDQLELLTQVLCGFLSYGFEMTATTMDSLYSRFGYCDLFKIMLHMNIKLKEKPGKKNKCQSPTGDTHGGYRTAWPAILYDLGVDFKELSIFRRHHRNKRKVLLLYFTMPKFDRRIPSMVELARDASRRYIMDTYRPQNSMQFQTVLKHLPIAEEHVDIISYGTKLYPGPSKRKTEDEKYQLLLTCPT